MPRAASVRSPPGLAGAAGSGSWREECHRSQGHRRAEGQNRPRDELWSLIEQLAIRDGPSGYYGSTDYESLDDPDLLIDIADWESPESRTTHLAKAMAAGAYGPAFELLAGPFRATVIRRLP